MGLFCFPHSKGAGTRSAFLRCLRHSEFTTILWLDASCTHDSHHFTALFFVHLAGFGTCFFCASLFGLGGLWGGVGSSRHRFSEKGLHLALTRSMPEKAVCRIRKTPPCDASFCFFSSWTLQEIIYVKSHAVSGDARP